MFLQQFVFAKWDDQLPGSILAYSTLNKVMYLYHLLLVYSAFKSLTFWPCHEQSSCRLKGTEAHGLSMVMITNPSPLSFLVEFKKSILLFCTRDTCNLSLGLKCYYLANMASPRPSRMQKNACCLEGWQCPIIDHVHQVYIRTQVFPNL